jgi:hypothetical protein
LSDTYYILKSFIIILIFSIFKFLKDKTEKLEAEIRNLIIEKEKITNNDIFIKNFNANLEELQLENKRSKVNQISIFFSFFNIFTI